jgi:hypothetical protein
MVRNSPTGTEISHEMTYVSPDSNRKLSNTRHSRLNLVTVNKELSATQQFQVSGNVYCAIKQFPTFRKIECPRNVRNQAANNFTQHHKRPESSETPLWEPKTSICWLYLCDTEGPHEPSWPCGNYALAMQQRCSSFSPELHHPLGGPHSRCGQLPHRLQRILVTWSNHRPTKPICRCEPTNSNQLNTNHSGSLGVGRRPQHRLWTGPERRPLLRDGRR